MKKINILLALLLFSLSVLAQSFEAPVSNPFGLNFDNLVLEYHFASFADLDGDGDQDMLVSDFDGFYYYLENTGTKTSPVFGTAVQNPFGISRVDYNNCSCNSMVQRFVDIDDDGDMDIIAIAWYGAEYWFAENIGTATEPSFSDFSNEEDWMPSSFTYGPYPGIDFADIDNDGDLDLFSCQGDKMNLIKNTGTANSPDFSNGKVEDPFGLVLSGKNLFPTLADIDSDGDYDLFVGGNKYPKEDFQYYENIGTADSAIFDTVVENPFELVNSDISYPSLAFVDINGDSDLDFFLGGKLDDNMAFDFYENKTFLSSIEESIESSLNVYPNPTNGEVFVETSSDSKINFIKVYNALGVIQIEINSLTGKSYKLNLEGLESGFYFIEVSSSDKSELIQLFKE